MLYLIFNEGYTASAGDRLVRVDLTLEAIRLTRMLHDSLPDDAEVTGLLALMLLTESRRAARTGDDGLTPLDEQDRTRWDADLISEGTDLIDRVWARREIGPYQLQAAIAAVHVAATSPEETDWPQVAALYLWLEQLAPTGPVRLSRVVAVARACGPDRALALLNDLNSRHHLDREPLTRQRERAVSAHLPRPDRRRGGRGDPVPRSGGADRQPGRTQVPARQGPRPRVTLGGRGASARVTGAPRCSGRL